MVSRKEVIYGTNSFEKNANEKVELMDQKTSGCGGIFEEETGNSSTCMRIMWKRNISQKI
jgi:hypothetical protein